ncbi:hypothetical protein BKH43_07550 [Helicobacter sp. 13S00401-1]|nr:hypothetical protein BKH43_07550 [Helicobacter sp. 13S00401-1]
MIKIALNRFYIIGSITFFCKINQIFIPTVSFSHCLSFICFFNKKKGGGLSPPYSRKACKKLSFLESSLVSYKQLRVFFFFFFFFFFGEPFFDMSQGEGLGSFPFLTKAKLP